VDYNVVPNCIYSSPEIASVGMSEAKAAEKGYKVKIGKFPFRASGKAIILGETEGLVKVIADEATEKLLGVHIMGIEATELIAEAAMAMKSGATTRSFLRICHGHPTLHEAMLEAAHDVHGNAIDLGKR